MQQRAGPTRRPAQLLLSCELLAIPSAAVRWYVTNLLQPTVIT
jgi:hypothetical protein